MKEYGIPNNVIDLVKQSYDGEHARWYMMVDCQNQFQLQQV
jgi:hypothetical protein